jgi:anti-sigma-K factor RskA
MQKVFWACVAAAACFALAAVMALILAGSFTAASGAPLVAAICFGIAAVALNVRQKKRMSEK